MEIQDRSVPRAAGRLDQHGPSRPEPRFRGSDPVRDDHRRHHRREPRPDRRDRPRPVGSWRCTGSGQVATYTADAHILRMPEIMEL